MGIFNPIDFRLTKELNTTIKHEQHQRRIKFMKKIIVSVTYLAALLWPQTNRAQGVLTYLDNTSQPIAGVLAMGNYGSVGTQFQTGTSPEGYLLNDLQLLFADATGNPIFSGLNGVLVWASATWYSRQGLLAGRWQ